MLKHRSRFLAIAIISFAFSAGFAQSSKPSSDRYTYGCKFIGVASDGSLNVLFDFPLVTPNLKISQDSSITESNRRTTLKVRLRSDGTVYVTFLDNIKNVKVAERMIKPEGVSPQNRKFEKFMLELPTKVKHSFANQKYILGCE